MSDPSFWAPPSSPLSVAASATLVPTSSAVFLVRLNRRDTPAPRLFIVPSGSLANAAKDFPVAASRHREIFGCVGERSGGHDEQPGGRGIPPVQAHQKNRRGCRHQGR